MSLRCEPILSSQKIMLKNAIKPLTLLLKFLPTTIYCNDADKIFCHEKFVILCILDASYPINFSCMYVH